MALLDGDVIQVSFRGLIFNQRIILTHTYKLVGDAPNGQNVNQDLADVITAVRAAGNIDLETPYLNLLPATYSLTEVRAQRITAPRTAYQSAALAGVVGLHAGAATVSCDSAAITLRGNNAGPRFHGTKKIGPCPDGASAAGLITAPYKALLTTMGNALLASAVPVPAWVLSTITPILYNRTFGDKTDVTSQRVGDTSRVMSRRVVGRGE